MTAIVALRAERQSRRSHLRRAVKEMKILLRAIEGRIDSDVRTEVDTDPVKWKTEAIIDLGRQLQAVNEAVASAERETRQARA